MVNKLLDIGIIFKTEKLSYKGFQKMFGRSVGLRAPGMFISMLRRKAESASGLVEEFSCFKTRLSQTCHCGLRVKKKLSQRCHDCPCGVKAQRDLYSAHLARFVTHESLDISRAAKAWATTEPVLGRAISRLSQRANSRPWFASFGIKRQSPSHCQKGIVVCRGRG